MLQVFPMSLLDILSGLGELETLEKLVALLAIFGVPIAVVRHLWALGRARALERAKLMTDVTRWFCEHKDKYREVFDALAYGTFRFNPAADAKEKSDKEKQLSTALDLLNTVAYNVHHNVIPPKEIRDTTFGYWFDVFLSSPEVQTYMQHVIRHDASAGREHYRSFYYLRKHGPRVVDRRALENALRARDLLIGQRARQVPKNPPIAVGGPVRDIP